MRNNRKLLTLVILSALLAIVLGVSATTNARSSKFDSLSAIEKVGESKKEFLEYKKNNELKLNKLSAELRNKKLNARTASQEGVLVTITFSKPLNEAQVTKLVNKYQIKVDHTIGRTLEPNGTRGSFGMGAGPNSLIDKEMLHIMFMDKKDWRIKGFIELVGYVPNENLQALAANKLVFLVDPSADPNLVYNPEPDFMPGVFWDLEDYKMVAP